jgi:hypothetical protein
MSNAAATFDLLGSVADAEDMVQEALQGKNQWPRQRRRGKRCMRVSVCNWQTGEADADRTVQAAQHALGDLAPSDERRHVSVWGGRKTDLSSGSRLPL